MTKRILFVDDEPNILKGLKRTLLGQKKIWDMHFATNANAALDVLLSKPFDVVVSDVSMPGRNGFDLLSTIRKTDKIHDIPVLMLTGLEDNSLKRKALDLGATDLLSKPAQLEDLMARINSMLRIKTYQDQIKKHNASLEQKVTQRTTELEAARIDLIWRLGMAAEYRDTDTGNHVIRVGHYCEKIAELIGMDSTFQKKIFLTSPLHDIGKIGIPDGVLLKAGKLTSDEWKIMQNHTRIGADILLNDTLQQKIIEDSGNQLFENKDGYENPLLKMAADIALFHHERWDGKGYPANLKGEAIPIEARIVAIADVYDALFSDRPYKPAYSENRVMEIMRNGAGSHFDAEIFFYFENHLEIFRKIRNQFQDKESESRIGLRMVG